MRYFRLLLALTAIVSCFSSGIRAGAQGTSEPLKVALLAPVTGSLAVNGNETVLGAQIATDLVNEAGGVKGRKIDLVVVDTPTVDEAKAAVERIVTRDGIKIIMGNYGSSLAIASATTATRYGAFMWEQSSSSYKVTIDALPYATKFAWGSYELAKAATDTVQGLISKRLHVDPKSLKLAIVHEDSAFGSDSAEYIQKIAKDSGLNVVAVEPYDAAKASDFTPMILRLKTRAPDIILAAGYANDSILFQQQAKAQNFYVKATIGLSAGYDVPAFGKALGKSADGILTVDSNPGVNPAGLTKAARSLSEEFVKRFIAKTGGRPPAGSASIAFGGTYTLLHYVLPRAASYEPADILKAVMSLNEPFGTLPMGFGIKYTPASNTDRPQYNERALVVTNQWQNGKLVVVAPDRFSTGTAVMIPAPPWANR